MNRGTTIQILSAVVLTGVFAVACHRDASANQAAQQQAAAKPDPGHDLAAPDGPGKTDTAQSRFDEAPFSLSISAKSGATKGQATELQVVLLAKDPYHVNPEYPHRFKVIASQGLTPPSNSIKVDTAKVTARRMDLAIPVTLGQNAPFGLTGEMSFSLCTSEKCLMEKRQLVVSVDAQ